MVDPSASGQTKTHHITLEDASGTKIGLVLCDSEGRDDPRGISRRPYKQTGIRFQEGDTKWSDFEDPYHKDAQDNWIGGRGLLDFNDKTRYWHGYMVNTMLPNKAFLGPQPTIAGGYRDEYRDLIGSTTFQALTGSTRYIARKFTVGASNFNSRRIMVWLKQIGTPGDLRIELRNDSGGEPGGTVYKQEDVSAERIYRDWLAWLHVMEFAATQILSASTDYWIVVRGDASDDADDHWEVGVRDAAGDSMQSSDGSSWSAASVDMYYWITDWYGGKQMIARFFEYKGALYFVADYDYSGYAGAPKLFINGDRGQASAGSATTLTDSSKAWTNDEHIGKILKIVGNTGAGQWREITDNDGTQISVSPAWKTNPDATSEYVIVADDNFTEITGHGLTGPITDIEVVKDVVYFCQGESVNIIRFNYEAGSNTFSSDGTNKATFLKYVHDSGGAQVHKANNGATVTTISRADPKSWGTNLTFGHEKEIGPSDIRITGLERYFDPEYLIIFTEGGVFRRVGDEIQQMPLREMMNVRSEFTGRASDVSGAYLWFSLLTSLQRYYNNQLDDKGPDRDDGLQPGYQGPIYDVKSYPGRIYVAVSGSDWGSGSFGSVIVHNGYGWHILYRGLHNSDNPIRQIHFQVIPGSKPDRLWVSEGDHVLWLPIAAETRDPTQDSQYKYFFQGMLQTSWMYANLKDVPKTFRSLKLFIDGATADEQYITSSWAIDEGWNAAGQYKEAFATFDTSPVQEEDLDTSQILGKRVQFKHVFWTTDETKTPILKASVLEEIIHLPTKFFYPVTFRARDDDPTLGGQGEALTAAAKISQIETWANSGTMLTMQHEDRGGPFDNKEVVISAPEQFPLYIENAVDKAGYLCRMRIFEV